MVLPSERVPWVNKHNVCMYVCKVEANTAWPAYLSRASHSGNLPTVTNFPHIRHQCTGNVIFGLDLVKINHYHSFSGPNVCLAGLQMKLCRATNIFAAYLNHN